MKNLTTQFSILITLLIVSFTSTLSAQSNNLVITEIMYNSPGVDLEFIEIYNNSADNINLEGYTVSNALEYTFSAFILPPTATVLITGNADLFRSNYGFDAFQWTSGALNNSGEDIVIKDSAGIVQDSVTYADGGEWTPSANGRGPSLVLCDPNVDNNSGLNWQRAITPTGIFEDGREVFANPNSLAACTDLPIIGILPTEQSVGEAGLEVTFQFFIDNPGDIETTIELGLLGTGNAENELDYTFMPELLIFSDSVASSQNVTIPIIDDGEEESEEQFILTLSNATNGALVLSDRATTRIIDNDAALTSALKIIGLVNGPISGLPKATQLLATADISNLSLFGLGSANNGGGSDGQEYTFPNTSIEEGTCFWVTSDTVAFKGYFGFAADYLDRTANNFNGDDALEVFENGLVIDVFGEIDVDGSGTDWEYAGGWARRVDDTGPDGSTFDISNWKFSGTGALSGSTTNADATTPYPLEECQTSAVKSVDLSADINLYPNPADQLIYISSEIDLENIIITDVLGITVRRITQPDKHTTIDVHLLQNKLYLISFETKDQRWTQKLNIIR